MKIVGGAQLGIIGCFGERELPDMSIQEVNNLLMKEYKEKKFSNYPEKNVKWILEERKPGLKVHVLQNKNGYTVFEWHVKKERGKEK